MVLRGRKKKKSQLNEDSDDNADASKGAHRFSFIDYDSFPPKLEKKENTATRKGTAGGDREIQSSNNN